MKFTVSRTALAEHLSAFMGISSIGHPAPPLLLTAADKLTLTCTGREMAVESTVDATVVETGSCFVPYRMFSDMVRASDGTHLEVVVKDNSVHLKGSGSRLTCRKAADTGEQFPSAILKGSAEFEGSRLADLLGRALLCVDKGEGARPLFTGVQFCGREGAVTLMATDVTRFFVSEAIGATDGEFVITVPSSALVIAQRMSSRSKSITMSHGVGYARFAIEGVTLWTALFMGEWPEPSKVLPQEYETKVCLNTDALLNTLKRAKLVAADGDLFIGEKDGNLNVDLAVLEAEIHEAIPMERSGVPLDPSIYAPRYLVDPLNWVGPEVVLEFNTRAGVKPLRVLRIVGEDWSYYLASRMR